jgi:hypothetical protein
LAQILVILHNQIERNAAFYAQKGTLFSLNHTTNQFEQIFIKNVDVLAELGNILE